MDFYSDIADFYEDIFPVGDKKVDFFYEVLNLRGARRVMDLGCGAGGLARSLAERGFSVLGLDSSASLLSNALKGWKGKGNLDFVVSRMEEMPLLGRGDFDAVLCIGNSLAHLPDAESIKGVLGLCGLVLRGGGVLCIQMMDFALIRARGVLHLPDISLRPPGGHPVCLRRIYRVEGEGVVFQPVLIAGESERKYRVPMCPLDYNGLWDLLDGLGFAHEATYCDYDKGKWTGESPSYVTIAKKGSSD